RALDIPARYVEGYTLNSQDFTDGTALVRDNQAHAWVEVYFQNFGWIPFDVTPPATYAPIENEEEVITDPLEENNTSSQQNQNNQNQTNTDDINTEVNAKTSFAPLYLLIVIVVILLAYGLYRWWLYKDCHSSDAKKNILHYYKRLLRLTPKVEEDIYQLVLKVRFSPHPITAAELAKMESYYHQKVSEIKKGSSLIKKVWITLLY
ncbi:MAG: transglutaminase-like domain-containing protein, partial [Beduini sp.]